MQVLLSNACKVLAAIDTPRALSVAILIRYEEWGQIADLRCDPSWYLTARSYALDCQATDLLRKLRQLPTGRDLEKAALDSFWASERKNHKTNLRLAPLLDSYTETKADLSLLEFTRRVKRFIGSILLRVPDRVDLRFGPGATFDDRGHLSTIPDKMTSRPTITSTAIPLLPFWYESAWGRAVVDSPSRGGVKVVRGDRFASVPKDNSKNRGIGIGPSINVSLQLGVGRVMRSRLARVGIDLNHGQEVHRRVACEASKTGDFATIDLSSASDTVSLNLVRLLLPPSWCELLETLRTPLLRLPTGKWVRVEKFSAMGNGYTFELETLLFLGICAVCMEREGVEPIPGVNLFVYGDDIIVPTSVAPCVLSALRFFGFSENAEKTFVNGSFRESCGGDYFDGQPVRAHFIKELPNEPHQLISLANGLRRTMSRFSHLDVVRRRLLRPWHAVLDGLPTDIRRLRGPTSLGDAVIHDTRGWITRTAKRCSQSREIRTWSAVGGVIPMCHWRSSVVLAAALYGVPSKGASSRGTHGYHTQWIALLEREPGS